MPKYEINEDVSTFKEGDTVVILCRQVPGLGEGKLKAVYPDRLGTIAHVGQDDLLITGKRSYYFSKEQVAHLVE